MDKTILHCDLNSFFASVECLMNPELRSIPIAVCGNVAERHGIVLAKNDIAKKMGIITGEAVIHAQWKCKNLVIVPPNYEAYVRYSNIVKEIYYKYTDLVEPFGIDECWLDVTGSEKLFGTGYTIARKISDEVKNTTGLTISVGVSYNKTFAKLGSDMKKPDAITCIDKATFKDKIWGLPANAMMGVGAKTAIFLHKKFIRTIGDIAKCNPENLKRWFGKDGNIMWIYANGLDPAPVMSYDYSPPLKSIGHGTTTTADLKNNSEVFDIFVELSQIIGQKLKAVNLMAKGVAIAIRDNKLSEKIIQCQIPYATQSAMVLVKYAKELFLKKYIWYNNIRSVTVRAINLINPNTPEQLNLLVDYEMQMKYEDVDVAANEIRAKYGNYCINPANHYKKDLKIVSEKSANETPMTMYMI